MLKEFIMKRNLLFSVVLFCSIFPSHSQAVVSRISLEQVIADAVGRDTTIVLHEGVYYLDSTIVIDASALNGHRLTIRAAEGEDVTVSGARSLALDWRKANGGLWKAACSICPDQLYVNGSKRILARYPDMTDESLWGGTSGDALSPDRVHRWKHPEGGYIHTMHSGLWGSQHYLITGKKGDELSYEGGYQVTRPSRLHPTLCYVENIREELDSPGEWFWDAREKMLYYYPLEGEDILSAQVQCTPLLQLLVVRGTPEHPAGNVTIEGIRFSHTARSFMQPYETLLRSDWGIFRGASVLFENTEDCRLSQCEFCELGGNALFVSRYAARDTVSSNHFHHIDGSAVCLVGDTSAVRSGSFGYSNYIPYDLLDKTPGPKNNLYPRECLVEDNLMHDLGLLEKQVAGVEIQVAALLTVRHNTIYDVPRAGINIGDGAFGGHVIEYNDVFDTVLETSDHGAFNSWGRDRYWLPSYEAMTTLTAEHPELILLDAVYTTTLRYNRFRCDHGWDIDLDDGSSNYHIYGNVCLKGGIKLREGFYRKVENNICLDNSLHPHVWFPQSHDIVRRNIFMAPYAPIRLAGWGEGLDYNFFSSRTFLDKVRGYGTDSCSVSGTLLFRDVSAGDYTVNPRCKAFSIGFENIPQDRFGVVSPHLKSLARQPSFPEMTMIIATEDAEIFQWHGAHLRSVAGLGDRSAYGLPDEVGLIVTEVAEGSPVHTAGLRVGDVIRTVEGKPVGDKESLDAASTASTGNKGIAIRYFRDQSEVQAFLHFPN